MRDGEQGFGQGELQYAAFDGVQMLKNNAKIPTAQKNCLFIIFFIKLTPFVFTRSVFPSYQVNAERGGFLTGFSKKLLFRRFIQRNALGHVHYVHITE